MEVDQNVSLHLVEKEALTEPEIRSLVMITPTAHAVGHKIVVLTTFGFELMSVLELSVVSKKWTQVEPTGLIPVERDDFAACLANDLVFMSGGETIESGFELWTLDLTLFEWRNNELHGIRIPPRFNHVCEFLPTLNSLIVLGGAQSYRNFASLNDIYSINVETFVVTCLHAKGPAPSQRRLASSFASSNLLFVYGGVDAFDNKLSDLHILEVSQGIATWHAPRMPIFAEILKRRNTVNSNIFLILYGKLLIYGGSNALNSALTYEYNQNKLYVPLNKRSFLPRPTQHVLRNAECISAYMNEKRIIEINLNFHNQRTPYMIVNVHCLNRT